MAIPDKVKFTAAEKAGEAVAGLFAAGSVVFGLASVISDMNKNGAAVINVVVTLIIYAAFTLCSFFPQWTNIMYNPENCTEKNLRRIRCGCIIVKIVLIIGLFAAISLPIYI